MQPMTKVKPICLQTNSKEIINLLGKSHVLELLYFLSSQNRPVRFNELKRELSITATANKPYGEGYVVGDTLNDAGAGVSTFTVRNIDLPNTAERGCCLYAGIAIDTGLDLILESGELYNDTYTARLKGITAGSFLPVLAKRVVAVTLSSGSYAAGDLIAIY